MKKRQWTSEQKLQIVMQGVKGRAVSEICNEYQIGQSQYYLWRDQFLRNAGKVFEMPQKAQQQSRLERENERLKTMVGELTMELKKRLVKHKRCRSICRTVADKSLLEQIRVIKSEHPFWGYRRVWAYLRFVAGLSVNRKRVYRLLKENGLLVRRDARLLAKRTSNTRKPRPERANQWWGIDMTKVMTRDGWAYVVLVLDWYSKKIVGHYCGEQSKAWHWLAALNKAVNRQFPKGIREMETELNLMSDNGSQPTSRSFMETCAGLGIKQAFTAYNNPKGNADTERMMRTLKEELCWLREWQSANEMKTALDTFVEDFNSGYLHSALGYKTPNAFEKEHFEKQQATLNLAA